MRTCLAWTLTKFWWLWSANALAAALVVFAFVLGWMHETITAPNIPAWCGILAAVLAIVGGSLWLRSRQRADLAVFSLLIIPLPSLLWAASGFLLGILYLVVSIFAHLFGHGRVN
jgi:hypothetical protein